MQLKSRQFWGSTLAGLGAGCVNGIFGAAGGIVLLPALQLLAKIPEENLFPMSVSVMLPVSILSLLLSSPVAALPWTDSLPYLIGGALGGFAAGRWGTKLPNVWLHRIFGIMILWGGIRYIW